jgi:TolB-like protein
MRGRRPIRSAGVWLAALLSGACAVRAVQPSPVFETKARWVVLPFLNEAETPQAGDIAQGITTALLRVRGFADLEELGPSADETPSFDARRKYEASLAEARSQGFTYAIGGRVQEWRYRTGAGAEPSVSLSVTVVDLSTRRVVWTATGARSGWSTDTAGGTAHVLLRELLSGLAAGTER